MIRFIIILCISFALGVTVLFGMYVYDNMSTNMAGYLEGCPTAYNESGVATSFGPMTYPLNTIFFQEIGGYCEGQEDLHRASVRKATGRIVTAFVFSFLFVFSIAQVTRTEPKKIGNEKN